MRWSELDHRERAMHHGFGKASHFQNLTSHTLAAWIRGCRDSEVYCNCYPDASCLILYTHFAAQVLSDRGVIVIISKTVRPCLSQPDCSSLVESKHYHSMLRLQLPVKSHAKHISHQCHTTLLCPIPPIRKSIILSPHSLHVLTYTHIFR